MAGAVVLAPAPDADGVLAGLAEVLPAGARQRLQAALIRRAAAWAAQIAGEHAVVAVEPPGGLEAVAGLVGSVRVEAQGEGARGARIGAAVQRAFDRSGGPVLVAGTDVPRLSPAHAQVALADLAEGGEASFGPSMDGGWYLAALAEPRAELFDLAVEVWEGPVVMARMLEVAQRLGLEIGLLRMERALRSYDDLAAMTADPLTPKDVFAGLPVGILRNAQTGCGALRPERRTPTVESTERNPVSHPPDPSRLRVVSLHDPSGVVERIEQEPAAVELRFNPIADLKRGIPAGYEAVFCIGDAASPLSPHGWSQQVHVQAAGQVEAKLVALAIAARERLPEQAFLAVDVSAQALCGEDLPAVLRDAGRLERLVLVVADDTHRVPSHAIRPVIEAVREAGGMIGVDETGSGYASLRQVLAVRPDFVRVGADFIVEVDRDQAKGAVVETLGALASRIDAWVIACGIPGRPELAALRRMGVPLGQGPMFGVPTTEPAPLPGLVAEAIKDTDPPVEAESTVASLVEARPALPWGATLDEIADAFLDDPRHDVIVLVDERSRPLALAERAALLRGEPYERPVMRITPTSPMKAVARRAAARPPMERFHPLVACDRRGVYLGLVRVEQLLDALAQ